MLIEYLEISNFRKLLSVRVDLAPKTTLLVGANNSGKTSAMIALRNFLVDPNKFCMNDFTLSNWPKINKIGEEWEEHRDGTIDAMFSEWIKIAPTLDIWLRIQDKEIHHVSKLIPTLDWSGGLLGVRLRYEPKEPDELRKEFLTARNRLAEIQASIPTEDRTKPFPKMWPEDMVAFLEKKLHPHFCVRAYALDPSKSVQPENGVAQPQTINADQAPIEGDALKGLIRVNEINAQRGFGDLSGSGDEPDTDSRGSRRLSAQLRKYYLKHLNPFENPESSDIDALRAIEDAQAAFDKRLEGSFENAMKEVEGLGYPGVTDPKLKISTLLRPVEGLNHETAVQYEIDTVSGTHDGRGLRLPEDFNGLGYQNLISMTFRLMSFRDAWMRVGKASKTMTEDENIQPLHLVLIEEPEAHLHAQVQQVFINRAYEILRSHKDLRANTTLNTQLVVSTHSNHVAHEINFSCLRYFRRLPAGMSLPSGSTTMIPVSTVVNLSKVFGEGEGEDDEDETQRFVARYLRAQHCELFFADAVILVEGAAERMLVPHFIRMKHPYLNQCYITILEIGGSHAHTLRPLIELLGLLTLIVTDLDAGKDRKAVLPERGDNQNSNNPTLRNWVPGEESVDKLLDLKAEAKICSDDGYLFAIRASYQLPILLSLNLATAKEALPNTFEDALVFENIEFFRNLDGTGLVKKFHDAIAAGGNLSALGQALFEALEKGDKAKFALDVIFAKDFETLSTPKYITEGLEWLEERLKKKRSERLPLEKAIKNEQ